LANEKPAGGSSEGDNVGYTMGLVDTSSTNPQPHNEKKEIRLLHLGEERKQMHWQGHLFNELE